MTTRFQTGKTYRGHFVSNHDSTIEMTVASRTAKMLTTTDGKRLGIKVYEDVEFVMPLGRYSMAPSIRADREVRVGGMPEGWAPGIGHRPAVGTPAARPDREADEMPRFEVVL